MGFALRAMGNHRWLYGGRCFDLICVFKISCHGRKNLRGQRWEQRDELRDDFGPGEGRWWIG